MIKTRKDIPFRITISYLLTLISIRLSVIIAGSAHSEFAKVSKAGGTPVDKFYVGRNIILFGYHVHHFYIGIFLVCLAAWFAIVGSKRLSRRHIAVIYGVGLGLFFDEIGLLLTWGDYYSGLTYSLSILIFAIFINIVFFQPFWESVRSNLLSVKKDNLIVRFLFKNKGFIKKGDYLSDKIGKLKRISLFFSGMLYLIITPLIIIYPQFLRYCIGGIFIVHGLVFFWGSVYGKSEV